MQRVSMRGAWLGMILILSGTGVFWAPPARARVERLKVAVAPLGWDTNFTWLQSRSGQLDKRPALEYLVGIDRKTGVYIPELAEKWEMGADGKTWTITLRQGVKFHENWGEFTARDVRHAVFLLTQPDSVQTDAGLWRNLLGIEKNDTAADIEKKLAAGVEIVNDHQVIFHLQFVMPEFPENISANADLPMESKARWDAGGKELYGQKVVGTGPFEFVERKMGSHVLYKRVDNHWRKTPEFRELEFRWVPEGVTRLASLLAEEVHISDVERALHNDAMAKGMKDRPQYVTGHSALVGVWRYVFFRTRETRSQVASEQARGAAGHEHGHQPSIPGGQPAGGRVQPLRINGYHPKLDARCGQASGIPTGIRAPMTCMAIIQESQSVAQTGGIRQGFCVLRVSLHPARPARAGGYWSGLGAGLGGDWLAAQTGGDRLPPGAREISHQKHPGCSVSQRAIPCVRWIICALCIKPRIPWCTRIYIRISKNALTP